MDESPALLAAREEIARRIGRVVQGAYMPNPVLRLETEKMPLDDMGFGNANNKVILKQRFETAGKADARVAAAAARKEEAEALYYQTRARLAARVAKDFFRAFHTRKKIEASRRVTELQAERLEQARALNRRGRLSELELIDYEVALQDSLAGQKNHEAEERALLRGIEGALGMPSGSILGCAGEMRGWSPPAPARAREDLLHGNPELILLDRRLSAAEAESEVEDSAAYPDFTVGVGYTRGMEITRDREDFVGAFVEVPLQLIDRNQGGRAASQAAIRKAGEELKEGACRLLDEWQGLSERFGILKSRRDLYYEKILPLLEKDLALRALQVKSGRLSDRYRLEAAVKREETLLEAIGMDQSLAEMGVDMRYITGQPILAD
jgi:cobalt-zinc-cadmium efflux system outer membrane protein